MTIETTTLEKIDTMRERFESLESSMQDPQVIGDMETYRKVAKEHADLRDLVKVYERYRRVLSEIAENEELIKGDDPELTELAQEGLAGLQQEREQLEEQIKELLIPRDPDDDKNVILEIRAGTGGEEAALFARDLFSMYAHYCEDRGFRFGILSHSEADKGGFKEVIVQVEGRGAYGQLRHESGVHRVQRVPVTEAQGRIHTSAVTVAVLPEAEDVEVDIDPKDLKIDVYRSQGPGGQSVNTTDSAVRITHLPTGMVVICQDEKSQHKNKAKALKILRARLLDQEKQKQHDERSELRRSQVGHGDRSEKIRTYNYPQNRVTDHRIGLTLHKLDRVMLGALQEIIVALRTHRRSEQLKAE